MKMTFWLPAGDDRLVPGCFDSVIGMVVPLKFGDRQMGTAKILAAEVASDGTGVEITYEGTYSEKPGSLCEAACMPPDNHVFGCPNNASWTDVRPTPASMARRRFKPSQ